MLKGLETQGQLKSLAISNGAIGPKSIHMLCHLMEHLNEIRLTNILNVQHGFIENVLQHM